MILWEKFSFFLALASEAVLGIAVVYTWLQARHKANRQDIETLARSLDAFKLQAAERYIQREDWVPMTSRVLEILEEHTSMLARLDERSRTKP